MCETTFTFTVESVFSEWGLKRGYFLGYFSEGGQDVQKTHKLTFGLLKANINLVRLELQCILLLLLQRALCVKQLSPSQLKGFYRTQVYLGSDLWVRVSETRSL